MLLLPLFAEIPFRIIACEIVNSQRWCGVTSRIEAVALILSLLTRNGIGHDAVSTVGKLFDTPQLGLVILESLRGHFTRGRRQ